MSAILYNSVKINMWRYSVFATQPVILVPFTTQNNIINDVKNSNKNTFSPEIISSVAMINLGTGEASMQRCSGWLEGVKH